MLKYNFNSAIGIYECLIVALTQRRLMHDGEHKMIFDFSPDAILLFKGLNSTPILCADL